MVVVPVVYTCLDGLRPAAVSEWLTRRKRAKPETRAAVPGGALLAAD